MHQHKFFVPFKYILEYIYIHLCLITLNILAERSRTLLRKFFVYMFLIVVC
jgi:hypothetical protein